MNNIVARTGTLNLTNMEHSARHRSPVEILCVIRFEILLSLSVIEARSCFVKLDMAFNALS